MIEMIDIYWIMQGGVLGMLITFGVEVVLWKLGILQEWLRGPP
jgi:hypothetical protein